MEVALADAVVVEEREEKALPAGWAWTTLGQITDTTRKRVKPQDYPDLRFIGMEHVEAHTTRLLGSVSARAVRSAAEYFEPGDVLYGRLRPYLNKVYCPDFEGLCSAEFIVFRHVSHLDSRYLQYFLNSWDFVSFASQLNEGDRPRVNFSQLDDYPFPLAPLAEQRRIVAEIEAQFTRLDAGVAALQRVQRALQRYRASVLKAACEGRLVPQDPGDEPAGVLLERILAERWARWEADELAKMRARGKTPKDDALKRRYKEPAPPGTAGLPALPGGWCWATVEQLGDVIGGLTKNSKRSAYPLQLPYLRVANVYAGELRLDEVKQIGVRDEELERALLQKDDLLVVEGNGSIDQIGRVALWDGTIDPCVHQNHVIKVRFHVPQVGKYVVLWLLSRDGRDQITRVASSTSGLHTLSLSKVASLLIPLPPREEQHRIIAEVERRLSVVAEVEAAVEANLKRAERLRQSILKRAFEGRLVPQDPADEPASVLLERIRAERADGNVGKKKAQQLRLADM